MGQPHGVNESGFAGAAKGMVGEYIYREGHSLLPATVVLTLGEVAYAGG